MLEGQIAIYGAGGQGRVVLDILRACGQREVIGFFDSDPSRSGMIVDGLPVLGDMTRVHDFKQKYPELTSIVAIGDNRARQAVSEQLAILGMRLSNAIHPQALVSPSAVLGCNVTVAMGAIVCAHAMVGNNVIINSGAIIEHEDTIEDNVHIAPGAKLAGAVRVRRNAFVGIGSTVIENLAIGEYSVVGAGAVVVRDVPPHTTVVGIPARPMREANEVRESGDKSGC